LYPRWRLGGTEKRACDTTRYDMVESVTTTVVEYVPGGAYARDKLSEGIDRLEEVVEGATDSVVELVPGTAWSDVQ
jgi:hypothetical protein